MSSEINIKNNDTTEHNCTICFEDIDKSHDVFILKCCHSYHRKCFLEYIKYNLKKTKDNNGIDCPLCRTKMETKYIMNDLITKFQDITFYIKSLEKKKNKVKKTLMFLNMKKCLWFKKRKSISEEEELMQEIEMYNCSINMKNKENQTLSKIYYNLVDRSEEEYNYFFTF